MTAPAWALTLAYWLHMLATVLWIGGLAAVSILFLPAARHALEPVQFAGMLHHIQRRLDPLAWFSLTVLLASGMLQMSANPNYQGFLTIDNRWATAILVKHLVFLAMIGVSAYSTWGVMPALRRAALRRTLHQGDQSAAEARLQRQEGNLLRLNLILGVFVLALTAVARAA